MPGGSYTKLGGKRSGSTLTWLYSPVGTHADSWFNVPKVDIILQKGYYQSTLSVHFGSFARSASEFVVARCMIKSFKLINYAISKCSEVLLHLTGTTSSTQSMFKSLECWFQYSVPYLVVLAHRLRQDPSVLVRHSCR